MSCSWWLVGLFALLFQVPPPDAGEEAGRGAGNRATDDPGTRIVRIDQAVG